MSRARWPAKFAYHVWLWTRSASSRPVAIARLTDIVWSALEYGSPRATVSHGVKASTSGPSDVTSRGAPKHRTSGNMVRAVGNLGRIRGVCLAMLNRTRTLFFGLALLVACGPEATQHAGNKLPKPSGLLWVEIDGGLAAVELPEGD